MTQDFSPETEKRLQRLWHETRDHWISVGSPDSGTARQAHDFVNDKLCAFLWDKVKADIEADRRKHPKAKRNQPVPKGIDVGEGRLLP
jgi:hypothetical protein